MSTPEASGPTVRTATAKDVPFVAQLDYWASHEPFGRSFWDGLLTGTGTATLPFLEAVFASNASRWGGVEDFILVEGDHGPMAGCAVFAPSDSPDAWHPLDLAKLKRVADRLEWSRGAQQAFEAAYRKVWGGDLAFLEPQAERIVEAVAVAPNHRGKGLGHVLMRAAKTRAKAQGAASLGVMVIHGNEAAASLYAKHFQPYVTFHEDYFDGAFPGVTKYRASL